MKTDKIIKIGQVDNTIDHTHESANRVYSPEGISPTLNTCGGGNLQPMIIVAMRGRNSEHPTSRESGFKTEQRLGPNNDGICNTLTTVQKDNMVLETVRIKQATKQGFVEMEVGGVADLSYPNSETRRGRVQENGTVAPTLTSHNTGIVRIESEYRIRKLTPLECFRLMGCTDDEAGKMLAVNSNCQCYKQAGNSIVVNVMAAMFARLYD